MKSKQLFDLMGRATSKAFDRVSGALGQETDPDLQIYNELKPQDFTALVQKYGEQGMLDYIRNMEAKRLGVTRRE